MNGNICRLVYSWLQRNQNAVYVNSLTQTGSLLEHGKQPNYTLHVNVAGGLLSGIIDPSCFSDTPFPFLENKEELMRAFIIFYQEASFEFIEILQPFYNVSQKCKRNFKILSMITFSYK